MPDAFSLQAPVCPESVAGRWSDDSGSLMHLIVHADGRVSGWLRLGEDGPSYRPYGILGTWFGQGDHDVTGIVCSVTSSATQATLAVLCGEPDAEHETLTVRWLAPVGPHGGSDLLPPAEETLWRRSPPTGWAPTADRPASRR